MSATDKTSFDPWALSKKDKETLLKSRVIISMSGGKDSTACALLLEKHSVPFEAVFMDTGWEHPVLYEYLDNHLEPRFGKIQRLTNPKYPNGMVDLVLKKKMFPSTKMRFCTGALKINPFATFIEAQTDAEVVSVVGIRRAESRHRSDAKKWKYDEELEIDVFHPLVDHSFDDVIQMHQEGGIAPNPLYLQGSARVGCFPCIYSRKSEIANVARLWPAQIERRLDLCLLELAPMQCRSVACSNISHLCKESVYASFALGIP